LKFCPISPFAPGNGTSSAMMWMSRAYLSIKISSSVLQTAISVYQYVVHYIPESQSLSQTLQHT
jgi:hypothetical protein